MGNKLSCANCNGNPKASNTSTTPANATSSRQYPHYHGHGPGASGGQSGGGGLSNMFAGGRSSHVLRLWAEVFHVSASSGAVRWTQVSDDLVPVSVGFVNGRFHVTAFNSRVDKVLDTWLTATRLGQASNCFVYWKDNVSGDTWGLNFTSAADARAFRECISNPPNAHQSGGHFPRRAESSYSLRDQAGGTSTREGHQPSKAGSGAHLTTKYYSNRTAISTPNSPSKRRVQADAQHAGYGTQGQQKDQQCTCDCLTAEALHKQRNGRIRYANFTRQDSGGTTQSSRSDGSLVRRQHERQQQYYRQNTRSMDEHSRTRICAAPGASLVAKVLAPANRRIQAIQALSHPHSRSMAGPHPSDYHGQTNGGYTTKAIVHKQATSGDMEPRSHSANEPRSVNASAQVTSQSTAHLVSTATTTDDLPQEGGREMPAGGIKPRSQRPKSLMAMTAIDSDGNKSRDRSHRSLEGRRRSLERMQCVDLTDASPPTPAHQRNGAKDQSQQTSSGLEGHQAAILDEYERELRRRLLQQGGGESTGTKEENQVEAFESLLKESMDDVAILMREVQNELSMIRAEERRFQSQSTQSLHRLSSASLNNPTHRSPVWDTLSIDGQLPFLPSFATSLSAYHNAYQSWDRLGGAGYLTSSEVSDDDRASLTTAVSDDEDGLNIKSSFRHRTGSGVNFECFGSVRKSGFLSVKKWLIRKRHTLELARKRGWKGYWVCLKGTTLLFYSCDAANSSGSQSSGMNNIGSGNNSSGEGHKSAQSSQSELTPKHLIFVEACLVQAVPEHPRRDNVFCLSTSFGDAYLFDATSLPERDHWISVIHTACAAQISRNNGRCAISHYIIEEYQRLERLVELDIESRQEADLLLSCASEEKQKQQLVSHVLLLDEKIEKNRLEIFRLKSYLSALTNDEGPNPKTLLSQASRRSKSKLNCIGVFTVSSLHAFNCAKNPQPLEKLHKRDSFSADYIRELYSPSQAEVPEFNSNTRVTMQIRLLTGELRPLEVPSNWTSEHVMNEIFGSGPEGREYFLRCAETGTVLFRNDLVKSYVNHSLLVTPKILFTIELTRSSTESLFGFSVESEMSNSNDLRVYVLRVEPNSIASVHGLCRHDEIMVINGALVQELDMMFVESVLQEELSLCLMIRSSRLEMPAIGQLLTKSESAHQLGIGTSFDNEKTSSVTDEFIESLVCPPPPSSDFSQLILSDTQLSKFIVPKVDNFLPVTGELVAGLNPGTLIYENNIADSSLSNFTPTALDNQHYQSLHGGGTNSSIVSAPVDFTNASVTSMHYQSLAQELKNSTTPTTTTITISGSAASPPSAAVSSITHMEKLIRELLDTENTYCQSLEQLVKLYLEPLSQNNFLTATDVKVLFGSILQIIDAQNEFRSELTEVGEHILGDCSLLLERAKTTKHQSTTVPNGKAAEPSVNELGVGYIADCFLKHCANFRNYSTFCASHARAVKLMADEKTALHEWLQKRSSGQISQSLESYLIRPIQRVLKYPLLLSQMKVLCSKSTVNHNKLEDAVKELEKVAEHINEMQRIHEEYGAIFEHLARNHARTAGSNGPSGFTSNGLVDLSPTALIHYGNVDWINSMEFLGKNCRKGVELNSIGFVFRQFVVFLCKETIRHRKRMPSARSTDVEIIRHQVLIPVIEVQVRANPQNDNEQDYKWDLIQLKMNAGKRSEKIYRLSNRTSEARNQFLRTIRQIIREDVRQMNILGFNTSKSTSQSSASGSGGKLRGHGQKAMPDRQQQQQSNRQQAKHQHQPDCAAHGHSSTGESSGHGHKVPCGLCGKEVALGRRQKELITASWKQRQDSSSTNSR